MLAAGCSSNHHVSPFPDVDPALLLRPLDDLEGHVARAEREGRASGLEVALRVEGKISGGRRFVALGLGGRDPLGRPLHAVRVATPASIVLALGPPALSAPDPTEPNELLPSLMEGGAYPSGTDFTGDGAPDVAVRAADGTLAVFRIDPMGATRYAVRSTVVPTRAMDANADGRPDLAGSAPVPPGDAISPDLVDVAIGVGTAFRNDVPDALAFHRARRDRQPPGPAASAEVRLRAAVERAYHALRAGDPAPAALQPAIDLAAKLAPLDDRTAASWVRWRGYLVDLVSPEAPAK